MDADRFDTWTRSLVTPAPRREALRLVAGTVASGLLGLLARREAAAACGKVGDPCGQDADCCNGGRCARNGTCRCKAGLTDCGGNCRNLQTNPNHCGACGTVCASGLCVAGVCCPPRRACAGVCCPPGARCVLSPFGGFTCVQACPPGQTRCGGDQCVDTQTDAGHCGNCLTSCSSNTTCRGGTCVPCKWFKAACAGDEECCPSSYGGQPSRCCNGSCATLNSEFNCGRCGNVCPDGTNPLTGEKRIGGCNNGQCCTRIYDTCGPALNPCCGAGIGTDCVHRANGTNICCGSDRIHLCPTDCQPGTACDGCCSGVCGADGRCGNP